MGKREVKVHLTRKGRRGEVRAEGRAEDNRRKEEEQSGRENKRDRGGRQEYATHVSSQNSLPTSQLPVLAARILTDRPYGFIIRHTHTQKHKPTHIMHEDIAILTNS